MISLDDKKYFTLSNSEIKGNDGFYTDKIEDVPNDVSCKKKAKLEEKTLVWYFKTISWASGEAVNANIHIQKCLQKHRGRTQR